MVAEVLRGLAPRSGGRYADLTVGGGGHAEAILEASAPDGRLEGCDRDETALAAAQNRLARFAGRIDLHHGDFAAASRWLGLAAYDGILMDLGVSSPQLDEPDRGFSHRLDGPLDMRMDRRQGTTAADLVNHAPAEELERLLREYGEEPAARRIARAIVADRGLRPFTRTRQLAELVERVAGSGGRSLPPATRVFQALRMAVNDEPAALAAGLRAAWQALRVGGRLAVVSFHSGEDRVVKRFGQALARDYEFEGEVDVPEQRRPRPAQLKWFVRGTVTPDDAEQRRNPRSRCARLRVMERLVEGGAA
jgi:16S rRNA (cytosine1402-N4)-methyltransferase